MLTSKPRKKATVRIVCPAGKLVPRPPFGTVGAIVPKWQKFYNWPRGKDGQPLPDAPDFPTPEDIPEVIVEVPMDDHHARMLYKGPCCLADAPAPKKPKTPKGGK